MINNVFGQKTQQQQNKQANIKILVWAGNWNRELLHWFLERYLSANESTEHIDYIQAIKLLQRKGAKT